MKLKLTVAGVQTYQRTVSRLSDEQLKLLSDELLNNPLRWLNRHFLLSKTELLFLKSMNALLMQRIIKDLSFALENRLPIEISYAQPDEMAFGDLEIRYQKNGLIQLYLGCFDRTAISSDLNCRDTAKLSPTLSSKANKLTDLKSTSFDNLKKPSDGM